MQRRVRTLATLTITFCGAAQAVQPEPAPEPPAEDGGCSLTEGQSDAESVLSLRFTGYAWLTSFHGSSGARGVEMDVNKSFADILSETDSVTGLMGAIDLTYDRFLVEFNAAYTGAATGASRGVARSGPLGGAVTVDATLDVDVQATWLEAFAGYRIVDKSLADDQGARLHLDAFAGFRYTTLSLDIDATADAAVTLPGGEELSAGVSRDLNGDADWFEPFVGIRTELILSDHWRLSLRGDVGGFGVDHSTFAWQAVAALGHEWNVDTWRITVFGGYRALGQDYSEDGIVWDVVTHGPILGLCATYTF